MVESTDHMNKAKEATTKKTYRRYFPPGARLDTFARSPLRLIVNLSVPR
jgi:hypothetical protein